MRNILNSPKKKIAAAAVAVLLIAGIILLATASAGASNTTRGIGLEKSIAVALTDAGLKEEQVSNLHGYFDKEDGIDAYDVSFNANGYEYEYSIKAADGAILECKVEAPDGQLVTPEDALDIGLDEALAAALDHAGLKKDDVEITKSKKDFDDGALVYEFKFHDGKAEYEYDIDATTGKVRTFSREVIPQKSGNADSGKSEAGSSGSSVNDSSGKAGSTSSAGESTSKPAAESSAPSAPQGSSSSSSASGYIGADKAKSIALNDAGVSAAAASFTKAKLDRDDGRYVYEIDFYTSEYEYDYEIDATTGKILDRDAEPLDDWDDDDDDDDDDDWDDDWDDDDWDDDWDD